MSHASSDLWRLTDTIIRLSFAPIEINHKHRICEVIYIAIFYFPLNVTFRWKKLWIQKILKCITIAIWLLSFTLIIVKLEYWWLNSKDNYVHFLLHTLYHLNSFLRKIKQKSDFKIFRFDIDQWNIRIDMKCNS